MSSHFNNVMRETDSISVTGKAMVVAIIVLFFAVIFVIFLHLYAKWFWGRNPTSGSRSRRLVFSSERDEALVPRRGLDPSIIRSLPVLIFQPAEFKDGLECAVCLCELSDGEKARLLPKCNHGFHLDCIDMWFQSHSTCPLCRNLVAPQSSQLSESEIQVPNENSIEGQPPESLNFPTNVLFWGTQDMVNTGRTNVEEGPSSSSNKEQDGNGKIVIEIPRRLTQGFSASSSLNSARSTEEEVKSPSTQLRSLKRFLGREKRVVVPSNPNGGDVEQGLGGNGQSFRVALDS